MPERMAKIRVVAPKAYMNQVISELYSLKAVHLAEHDASELETGNPLEEAEKLSELLLITKSLASHLGIRPGPCKSPQKESISDIEKKIRHIQQLLTERLEKQKALDEKLNALSQAESELAQIKGLGLQIGAFSEYSSISCLLGRVKEPQALSKKIGRLTEKYKLYFNAENSVIALFIDNQKKQDALEILNSYDFSQIMLTATRELKGGVDENLQRITAEKELIERRRQEILAELEGLGRKWGELIRSYDRTLSEELEKAEAPLKFGATKNIFILSGYIPKGSLNHVKKRLEIAASGKMHIQEEEIGEPEHVPVKLKNVKYARPFEFLIRLRGLPHYDEIDPTFMVFLTFPLFFGFMLGDIGYGLVTLAIALALRSRMQKAKSLLTLIAVSAVTSMLFGIVFGEFFGEESIMGWPIPHLLSRAGGIQSLLLASIIFGALHINLGLVLGFFNELRHHGLKSAMLEKFSWFIIELGAPFILSLLGIIRLPQHLFYASGSALAVGIIMLTIAEAKIGAIGPVKAAVESITIFSNAMSYARLMAVGIASVELALIVNEFAKELFRQGGLMIMAGIAVLLIGHVINLLLGVVGSFLHSMRLEYVEFFTKFFKGGAEPYKPFGEKN
ncbi:V-type ATP synthase subunit I [Candidatus Woesearchaeota archaeon]|nr:V-type ATP synthase subunit I [Candidatus Woesearchaeota archaeon]